MAKLIIQIPCLNEAETLPATLADLPRQVPGFDTVEWLVIDDGSTDGTAQVARRCGADHVISLGGRRGLARAFLAGLDEALRLGAEVIVNTDADNQYQAASIPALTAPILAGEALIVVGERPIAALGHLSPLRKGLQKLGSAVVRLVSGARVADAPSGFRAIHREAALQLNVFGAYTYTLETIIQAGRRGIPIVSVPVGVNPPTRPSRLIRSLPDYLLRSAITILRIFVLYAPLRFFFGLTLIALLPALAVIGRFLWFVVIGEGGHLQSLILAGALLAVAAVTATAGVLADLLAANRQILEDIRCRQRRQDLGR